MADEKAVILPMDQCTELTINIHNPVAGKEIDIFVAQVSGNQYKLPAVAYFPYALDGYDGQLQLTANFPDSGNLDANLQAWSIQHSKNKFSIAFPDQFSGTLTSDTKWDINVVLFVWATTDVDQIAFKANFSGGTTIDVACCGVSDYNLVSSWGTPIPWYSQQR